MLAISRDPTNRWPESWRLLAMLADSARGGVTAPMLASHGFPTVTIDMLVADGFAALMPRSFANPAGLKVDSYFATADGIAALARRAA